MNDEIFIRLLRVDDVIDESSDYRFKIQYH